MRWLNAARVVLDRIEATQDEALERASTICADAIAADGLVHLFGTGHSRTAGASRYGSYPGFHPLVELSLTSTTPTWSGRTGSGRRCSSSASRASPT